MSINNERLLKTFLEYVQIDSETGFEKEIADRLESDLKAIGLNAKQDNCGAASNSTGNNVYCYIEGDNSFEPMVFCAHMDTVAPGKGIKPVIRDGMVYSDGTTILGADDKSGVAAIMEAIRTIKEQKIPHRPIEILFTIREESGMIGIKNFDHTILKSKKGIVLDSGGPVGSLIVTAPGQLKITANVIGKAAHAGTSPQNGISAIQTLAYAVTNMKLLRIDEETTANIGTFNAGFPTNIVPNKATFIAEARSLNYDKLLAQGDHMKKCLDDACKKFGATLECEVETSYISYKTEDDSPILSYVSGKCEALGLTVAKLPTGGGSDANVLRQKGVEVLNIGIGMAKVHTTTEEIKISDMELATKLVLELMKP